VSDETLLFKTIFFSNDPLIKCAWFI